MTLGILLLLFFTHGPFLLQGISPFIPEASALRDLQEDTRNEVGESQIPHSTESAKEKLEHVSAKVKNGIKSTQEAAQSLKDKGKEKIRGLRQLVKDWMGDDDQWIMGMSSLGWQDTGHSYMTVLEAPGIPASDLNVHYSPREHCITVSGNHTLTIGDLHSSYQVHEVVRLPYDVFSEDTAQKIQAIWKDGLVIIQVPYQGRKADVSIPVRSGIPLTEKLRSML